MIYQSEIRPTQITQLLEKVQQKSYGKYLLRINLKKLRAFSDKEVRFDFPVTALIGPNGGGKTTVLGAAGLLYKDVRPGRFFTKSGAFDDSMADWSVEYAALDRSISNSNTIIRTASFRNRRWARDNSLARKIIIFGVSRTVPVVERTELRRCASTSFSVPIDKIASISKDVVSAAESILGKDITNYTQIKVDSKGKVSLLAGQTSQNV